jgi:hypothetical protein
MNLYEFVGNDGVTSWDYLGNFIGGNEDVEAIYENQIKKYPRTHNAWISEETYQKIKAVGYKGHREMANQKTKCKRWNVDADFDWRYEDDIPWYRAGYSDETSAHHFQQKSVSEGQVQVAINSCNGLDFERSIHRLQDYWSHAGKGFNAQGGHAVGGHAYRKVKYNEQGYGRIDGLYLSPDLDNVAWENAHAATKTWLAAWNQNCCCKKNNDGAMDVRTHTLYGWVNK